MRTIFAILALSVSASAADNADPGGSSMGSLIMGSWKAAEREGFSDFCFTGMTIGMNIFHKSNLGADKKDAARMSGYYNLVITHFKSAGKPRFSVEVHEPNGTGPNDPTFPLYHYMTHVDGDTVVGHRECIGELEVDFARAVGLAARMGLATSSGGSQYLELRRASDPEEPGWSDPKLRGRTYWLVVETIKGRDKEFYVDALTGKPVRKPIARATQDRLLPLESRVTK